jgi:hypothetical protein
VTGLNFTIEKLGGCRFPSPIQCRRFTEKQEHLLYHSRYEEVRPSIDPEGWLWKQRHAFDWPAAGFALKEN